MAVEVGEGSGGAWAGCCSILKSSPSSPTCKAPSDLPAGAFVLQTRMCAAQRRAGW